MSQEPETPQMSEITTGNSQDPFTNMDTTYQSTASRRESLISRLEEVIATVRIDPSNDKPSVTESKLRVYEVALSVLAQQEKAAKDKVDVAFKQKEQTTNTAIGATVAALLKTINVPTYTNTNDGDVVVPDYHQNLTILDKACSEAGVVVKEGELYQDSTKGID